MPTLGEISVNKKTYFYDVSKREKVGVDLKKSRATLKKTKNGRDMLQVTVDGTKMSRFLTQDDKEYLKKNLKKGSRSPSRSPKKSACSKKSTKKSCKRSKKTCTWRKGRKLASGRRAKGSCVKKPKSRKSRK